MCSNIGPDWLAASALSQAIPMQELAIVRLVHLEDLAHSMQKKGTSLHPEMRPFSSYRTGQARCMHPHATREKRCGNSSKPNNFFVAPGSVDLATKLKTIASSKPGHHEPGCQVRDRLQREGNQSRPYLP